MWMIKGKTLVYMITNDAKVLMIKGKCQSINCNYGIGRFYLDDKNYEEAITKYDKAIEIYPRLIDANKEKGSNYYYYK